MPPETKPERHARAAAPAIAAPAALDQPRSAVETDDAADVLRRYFALIGERRFTQALKLREPDRVDADAFAAHFERFASQRVTVGTPSEPAEADGWLYVEVPILTYGTMQDGKSFGNAGTVTLRRRKPGGEWRIFTKG